MRALSCLVRPAVAKLSSDRGPCVLLAEVAVALLLVAEAPASDAAGRRLLAEYDRFGPINWWDALGENS